MSQTVSWLISLPLDSLQNACPWGTSLDFKVWLNYILANSQSIQAINKWILETDWKACLREASRHQSTSLASKIATCTAWPKLNCETWLTLWHFLHPMTLFGLLHVYILYINVMPLLANYASTFEPLIPMWRRWHLCMRLLSDMLSGCGAGCLHLRRSLAASLGDHRCQCHTPVVFTCAQVVFPTYVWSVMSWHISKVDNLFWDFWEWFWGFMRQFQGPGSCGITDSFLANKSKLTTSLLVFTCWQNFCGEAGMFGGESPPPLPSR